MSWILVGKVRPEEAKWSCVLTAITHLGHKWWRKRFHTRVQADTQLHVILSVLFSVPKLFPHLLLSSQQRIGRFFLAFPPAFQTADAVSIVMRRSRGRKQGPWGLVDPCHMTRETHKVSLGSQKRSCRVVGLHERHEGPNQNSVIVALSFEVMNECQISCLLKHALGLSNIVNALNDATI